ncbi:MAG: energy transducer TonB, partial [Pseudomonadales bacterium]|nr:energy transducer TonB [Pseudomonadales bacterium]
MRKIYSFCLSLLICVLPQATRAEATPVESYIPPERIELRLHYPAIDLQNGNEGWVEAHMMVSPEGKVYEPVIIDSSGGAGFERAAIRALKKGKFKPASLHGEPIDAGMRLKLTYRLKNKSQTVSREFHRDITEFIASIGNGDVEAAGKYREQLLLRGAKNLFEDAWLNFAMANYYQASNDKEGQYRHLKRAVAYESKESFLPASLFQSALVSMFALNVERSDFAAALATWKMLEPRLQDNDLKARLNNLVHEVRTAIEGDSAIRVKGQIDQGYGWAMKLVRSEFFVEPSEGRISELKLRCEKQYIGFPWRPDIAFRVPKAYGACVLQGIGDRAAEFTAVQMPEACGESGPERP